MIMTTGSGGPKASTPFGGGHDKNNPDGADNAVGPLLARANLLRMRGQWDEAITVCADALRRAPKSPTAHSLMGDIYDAQGKFADAAQWYAMALDLAPESRLDREKLERSTKAAQQNANAVVAVTNPERGVTTSKPRSRIAPASERTLEWFDRVFPPGKGEGIARLIFAVSGVATALILGATAFVYFTFVRDDARETAEQASQTGLVTLGQVRTTAPTRASTPPAAFPAPSASPATTVFAPPTNAPIAPSDGSATEDSVLLASLKAALPPSIVVTVARFDTRASQVLLEAVLPASMPGETPAAIRERVLRAAVLFAKAAQAADKRVVRANVRIALASDKGPNAAPTLTFAGETTSVQARDADPATASYGDLIARFVNPWWTPNLAPGA